MAFTLLLITEPPARMPDVIVLRLHWFNCPLAGTGETLTQVALTLALTSPKAEVVRRSVARAEEVERMASDPVAELLAFHAQGALDAAQVSGYLEQVHEDRTHWRGGL